MGLLSWIILLAVSAVLATAVQYLFFRHDRKNTDYDWVYIAGGALLGGFTAAVWYPIGPVVDGLHSCRPWQARSSGRGRPYSITYNVSFTMSR